MKTQITQPELVFPSEAEIIRRNLIKRQRQLARAKVKIEALKSSYKGGNHHFTNSIPL